MELSNYFGDEYFLIDPLENNEIKEFFLESYEEQEVPLVAIYMHKSNHEMFFVIDCKNKKLEYIKSLCEELENRVLNFVNFSDFCEEYLKYLKYNISLIILCNNIEGYEDDHFRFEKEKSTRICRKLFILCDEDGHINEDDEVMLPFYFEPLQQVSSLKTRELEAELNELLPKDSTILSICEKKSPLTRDDIEIISRWLIKDDIN